MRPKRRLGQHFLTDPSILGRIVAALDLGPDDLVLEIGPGQGSLTAELAQQPGQVTAIERDRDLIAPLRQRCPTVTVIQGDALRLDWHDIVGQRPFVVAGNIPYNITTPLIDKALAPPPPARIVFLVQAEVAQRVTAVPGTKAYGALTVGVQTVAQAELLFTVPAGAFRPVPKVDSAALRLTPFSTPRIAAADRATFRKLVTGLFAFRRKQLHRAVRELTGWPAPRVTEVLDSLGFDPEARPGTLAPSDFVDLDRRLVDEGWQPR